jgi:ribosomal protein L37E
MSINTCSVCDGPLTHMGQLGNRTHYRCRNCGIDQSVENEEHECEACGDPDASNDWETLEGQWLCCECASDTCQHHPMGYDDDYLIDGVGFADPGGVSALRAATASNPRNLPCPTCGEPNRLTPADRARGYQCDACANQAERGW